MATRKPHPSSVLKNLPDEDQEALFEFLKSGKTLAEGVKWVFSNNGVRTNDSSLSDWRGWYELNRRIHSWNADAEGVKTALMQSGNVDADLVGKIGEAVFLVRAAQEGDIKAFVQVASIVQRHTEQKAKAQEHADKMQIQAKRLELSTADLERKNRELEARLDEMNRQRKAAEDAITKAKTEGGMTEETVRAVREALGMKPDAEEPKKA